MTSVTNFYLIHNKPDGTNELLGLFNDQQIALDVRCDWNEHSGIPIHEMIIMERTDDFEDLNSTVDNQE